MSQSSTLFIGMDVHNDPMAVAYGALDQGAAVTSLGPRGTRPGALAPLVRQRPSQAPPLLFVSAAGPCGSWLSRSLTPQASAWGKARPPADPSKLGPASPPTAETPGHGPAGRARALCVWSRSPWGKRQRCGPGRGPVPLHMHQAKPLGPLA